MLWTVLGCGDWSDGVRCWATDDQSQLALQRPEAERSFYRLTEKLGFKRHQLPSRASGGQQYQRAGTVPEDTGSWYSTRRYQGAGTVPEDTGSWYSTRRYRELVQYQKTRTVAYGSQHHRGTDTSAPRLLPSVLLDLRERRCPDALSEQTVLKLIWITEVH